MTEIFHEMLAYVLEKDAGLSRTKARSLSSFFEDIPHFISVQEDEIREIHGIGNKTVIRLSDNEINRVLGVIKPEILDPEIPVTDNYISAICRTFTKTQLEMIRSLDLTAMNPNPFLIKSLNLLTPSEFIKFNVYALVTRSIVTSMGFYIEKFLLASSENVVPGKKPWDLLKQDLDGTNHWVQIKSGPNDMDKDQVLYWAGLIEEKILSGDRAYIGITYGKRANETISLNHLRTYLDTWEEKTLIGRELWDFIADDVEFHERLFTTLLNSARSVLSEVSFCDEIEQCIERLTIDFTQEYGDGEEGINAYINEIF
jgi:hypothetical protein